VGRRRTSRLYRRPPYLNNPPITSRKSRSGGDDIVEIIARINPEINLWLADVWISRLLLDGGRQHNELLRIRRMEVRGTSMPAIR